MHHKASILGSAPGTDTVAGLPPPASMDTPHPHRPLLGLANDLIRVHGGSSLRTAQGMVAQEVLVMLSPWLGQEPQPQGKAIFPHLHDVLPHGAYGPLKPVPLSTMCCPEGPFGGGRPNVWLTQPPTKGGVTLRPGTSRVGTPKNRYA